MKGPIIFVCALALSVWVVGMALGLAQWPTIFTSVIDLVIKVVLLVMVIALVVMDAVGSARHDVALVEARHKAMREGN